MAVDHPGRHLLDGDVVAGDGDVERLAVVAAHRQRDIGPTLTPDSRDLVLHGRAVDRRAVHGKHHVARPKPCRLGRRPGERCDDHQHAAGGELVACLEVAGVVEVLDGHLGADAAEAAGQVAQRLLVLLRRHVAGVRILDAVLEHATDCALGQPVRIQVVDVLALQPVVGLAKRGEGLVGGGAAARAGSPAGQEAADEEHGAHHGGERKRDHPGHEPAARACRGRRCGVRIGHSASKSTCATYAPGFAPIRDPLRASPLSEWPPGRSGR